MYFPNLNEPPPGYPPNVMPGQMNPLPSKRLQRIWTFSTLISLKTNSGVSRLKFLSYLTYYISAIHQTRMCFSQPPPVIVPQYRPAGVISSAPPPFYYVPNVPPPLLPAPVPVPAPPVAPPNARSSSSRGTSDKVTRSHGSSSSSSSLM